MHDEQTVDSVRQTFRSCSVIPSGDIYLPRGEAVSLIDLCENSGLAVVRIEAFMVRDDGLFGCTAMIFDCPEPAAGDAWARYCHLCNSEARDFIETIEPSEELFHHLIGIPSVRPADGMAFAFVIDHNKRP